MTIPKRYEITDEQWQRIDDLGLENVSLDSTSICVHQKATGAKKCPLAIALDNKGGAQFLLVSNRLY
ncbi:MAG: hypothetical protein ABF855_10730 [Liquorilactobacillus satsumensis]|uniref:hypothetical protein n=1 Tax=Liquorilactobacillus satsumensis TaxID=259059 RepID=UPI0039EC9583